MAGDSVIAIKFSFTAASDSEMCAWSDAIDDATGYCLPIVRVGIEIDQLELER